jgi:hypothetical protein
VVIISGLRLKPNILILSTYPFELTRITLAAENSKLLCHLADRTTGSAHASIEEAGRDNVDTSKVLPLDSKRLAEVGHSCKIACFNNNVIKGIYCDLYAPALVALYAAWSTGTLTMCADTSHCVTSSHKSDDERRSVLDEVTIKFPEPWDLKILVEDQKRKLFYSKMCDLRSSDTRKVEDTVIVDAPDFLPLLERCTGNVEATTNTGVGNDLVRDQFFF